MTVAGVFYRDNYRQYLGKFKLITKRYDKFIFISLACSGRVLEFYYDPQDFYLELVPGTSAWRLSFAHPFHALTLFFFCGSMVFAPLGYGMIFR